MKVKMLFENNALKPVQDLSVNLFLKKQFFFRYLSYHLFRLLFRVLVLFFVM